MRKRRASAETHSGERPSGPSPVTHERTVGVIHVERRANLVVALPLGEYGQARQQLGRVHDTVSVPVEDVEQAIEVDLLRGRAHDTRDFLVTARAGETQGAKRGRTSICWEASGERFPDTRWKSTWNCCRSSAPVGVISRAASTKSEICTSLRSPSSGASVALSSGSRSSTYGGRFEKYDGARESRVRGKWMSCVASFRPTIARAPSWKAATSTL